MVAGGGVGNDGGHLLFEVEHSVEPRRLGRPVHAYKNAKDGGKADNYKLCADATVACLGQLLEDVGFTRFSILVNRRVLRPKDWQSADADFPLPQQDPTSPPTSPSAACPPAEARVPSKPTSFAARLSTHPSAQQPAIVPAPPPCPRARRSAAARYPRPGAFEVSAYDAERAVHRVLYSKYHSHILPADASEIWEPLLPFLLVFAGQCNDEELMNRISGFARTREILVSIQVEDLLAIKGQSLLLDFVLHAVEELNVSVTSGDPEQLHHAVDGMPHGLRTATVLEAEKQLEHLGSVQDKVTDALQKIETGFVTSGLECLQRALEAAEREGLRGAVLQDGLDYLAAAQQREELDEDDARSRLSNHSPLLGLEGPLEGRRSIFNSDIGLDDLQPEKPVVGATEPTRKSPPLLPPSSPSEGRPRHGSLKAGILRSGHSSAASNHAQSSNVSHATTPELAGSPQPPDNQALQTEFRGRRNRRSSEVVHDFLTANTGGWQDVETHGSGARRRSRSAGEQKPAPESRKGSKHVDVHRRPSLQMIAQIASVTAGKKVRQSPDSDTPRQSDNYGRTSPISRKCSSRNSARMPGQLSRRISQKAEMREVEAEMNAQKQEIEALQECLRDAAEEFSEFVGPPASIEAEEEAPPASPKSVSDPKVVGVDKFQGFMRQVKAAMMQQREKSETYSSEAKSFNDECSELRKDAEAQALNAKLQMDDEIAACFRAQEEVQAAEARIVMAEIAESAAAEREAKIATQVREARFTRDDAMRRALASQAVTQTARSNETAAYAALERERFECEASVCEAALQEAAACEEAEEQLRISEAAVCAAAAREGAMINIASQQVATSRAAALEAAAQEAAMAKATAEQVALCQANEAAAEEVALREKMLREFATDQAVQAELAAERAQSCEAATAGKFAQELANQAEAIEKASSREAQAQQELQEILAMRNATLKDSATQHDTEVDETMKRLVAAKESDLLALEDRSAKEAMVFRQSMAQVEEEAEQAKKAAAQAAVELQMEMLRANDERAAIAALLVAAEQEAVDARKIADEARAEAAELKEMQDFVASIAAASPPSVTAADVMPIAANLPAVIDLPDKQSAAVIALPAAPEYYTRQTQTDTGDPNADVSCSAPPNQSVGRAPPRADVTEKTEQQALPPSTIRSRPPSPAHVSSKAGMTSQGSPTYTVLQCQDRSPDGSQVVADSVASWSWDGGSADIDVVEEVREVQASQPNPAISDELSAIVDIVLSRPSNPVAKVLAIGKEGTSPPPTQGADLPKECSSQDTGAVSCEAQDPTDEDARCRTTSLEVQGEQPQTEEVEPETKHVPSTSQAEKDHRRAAEDEARLKALADEEAHMPSFEVSCEDQPPNDLECQGSLSLSAESQLGDSVMHSFIEAPLDSVEGEASVGMGAGTSASSDAGLAGTRDASHMHAQQHWEANADPDESPALAAPGEAPYFASYLDVAEAGLQEEVLMCASPTNASRGEAPMGPEEAEAAPGEAPQEADLMEQQQLEEALSPSPDPLGDASTGEAPVDGERLEPASPEAQVEGILLADLLSESQDFAPEFDGLSVEEWMLMGASTGEAPHTEVAETGEAPHEEQSSADALGLASHSTGGAPHAMEASHSTGEAPQTESHELQTGPAAVEPEMSTLTSQEASHSTGEAPQGMVASHSTGEAPQTEVPEIQVVRRHSMPVVLSHSTGEAPQTESQERTPQGDGISQIQVHSTQQMGTGPSGGPNRVRTASHSTGEAPQTEIPEPQQGPSQMSDMTQSDTNSAQLAGVAPGAGANRVTASHSTGEAPQTEIHEPQPAQASGMTQNDTNSAQLAGVAQGAGANWVTASHSTGEAPQTEIQEPQPGSAQASGMTQVEVHATHLAGAASERPNQQVAASHSTGEAPQTDSWEELSVHGQQGGAAEGDISMDLSNSHSTGEAPQIDTSEWEDGSPPPSVGTTPRGDAMGFHSTGEAPQMEAPQQPAPEYPTSEAFTGQQTDAGRASHSTGGAPQTDATPQSTAELPTTNVFMQAPEDSMTQIASHSTGEAPQMDVAQLPAPELLSTADGSTAPSADRLRPSHSTGELPEVTHRTSNVSHSTGEAPQIDVAQEAPLESSAANEYTLPSSDSLRPSHSTGELPEVTHRASHSTGEAPQIDVAQEAALESSVADTLSPSAVSLRPSHSTGDLPEVTHRASHSTGEAPQMEVAEQAAPEVSAVDAYTAPSPDSLRPSNSAGELPQMTHSTGEAPQIDGTQQSLPELPSAEALASHSTGEAPQTDASHSTGEAPQRNSQEEQSGSLIQALPDTDAMTSHSTGEAPMQDAGTTGEAPVWGTPQGEAVAVPEQPCEEQASQATLSAAQAADPPAQEEHAESSVDPGREFTLDTGETCKLCLYSLAGKLHLHYSSATPPTGGVRGDALPSMSEESVMPRGAISADITLTQSSDPEISLPIQVEVTTEMPLPPEAHLEASPDAAPEAPMQEPLSPVAAASETAPESAPEEQDTAPEESAPEEQDTAPEAAPESAPETSPESGLELTEIEGSAADSMPHMEPESSHETVTAVPEAAPEAIARMDTPEASPEAATEDATGPFETAPSLAPVAPEAAPESSPEEEAPATDTTPEAIHGASPEAAPEAAHEVVHEAAPETTDQDQGEIAGTSSAPEASPEASPEAPPEAAPEAAPEEPKVQDLPSTLDLPDSENNILEQGENAPGEADVVVLAGQEEQHDVQQGPADVHCAPPRPASSAELPPIPPHHAHGADSTLKNSVCLGYEEASRMIDCALVAVRSGDPFQADADNGSLVSDVSNSSGTSRDRPASALRVSDTAAVVAHALQALHIRWNPAETRQDVSCDDVFALWEQGLADCHCSDSTVDFEMENDAEHAIILNELPSEFPEQAVLHVSEEPPAIQVASDRDEVLTSQPTEPDRHPVENATDACGAAVERASTPARSEEEAASAEVVEELQMAAPSEGEWSSSRVRPGERLSIPSDGSEAEQKTPDAPSSSSAGPEIVHRGKPKSKIAPQRTATWCVGMHFPLTAEFLRELSQRQEQFNHPAMDAIVDSCACAAAEAVAPIEDTTARVGIAPSGAVETESATTVGTAGSGAAARTMLVCEPSGELQLTYDSSPSATTMPGEGSPGQSQAPTAAPDTPADGSLLIMADAPESSQTVAEMAELRLQGTLLRERCRALERELRTARNGTLGAANSSRPPRRRR